MHEKIYSSAMGKHPDLPATAAAVAAKATTAVIAAEAASSLALASTFALAATTRPSTASTYNIDVGGIRLAASSILANLVGHLVAIAGVARHHLIPMEEEAAAIVVIDETITFLVVEKLDRPRCTSIAVAASASKAASKATTEAASSLAFATTLAFAAAAKSRPASTSADDLDVDGIRLAASSVLANVVCHLVAIARVPRHHIIPMEEEAIAIVLVDEAEAFGVIEKLDRGSTSHDGSKMWKQMRSL